MALSKYFSILWMASSVRSPRTSISGLKSANDSVSCELCDFLNDFGTSFFATFSTRARFTTERKSPKAKITLDLATSKTCAMVPESITRTQSPVSISWFWAVLEGLLITFGISFLDSSS